MLRATAFSVDRIDYHHHARLMIHGREELAGKMVEGRLTPILCAVGCAWIIVFVFCNNFLRIPEQVR